MSGCITTSDGARRIHDACVYLCSRECEEQKDVDMDGEEDKPTTRQMTVAPEDMTGIKAHGPKGYKEHYE